MEFKNLIEFAGYSLYEVVKANPNKNLLKTSFNSLKFIIGSIATLQDFIEGINKLGALLGILK